MFCCGCCGNNNHGNSVSNMSANYNRVHPISTNGAAVHPSSQAVEQNPPVTDHQSSPSPQPPNVTVVEELQVSPTESTVDLLVNEQVPDVTTDPSLVTDGVHLDFWLDKNLPSSDPVTIEPAEREAGTWVELRLFISSTFIDTQAERDALVKRVIPNVNRKLAARLIRIVPVDLRWGVLAEESSDCRTIQKTCLNQVDKCRKVIHQTPWFLGIRTARYGWVQNELMPSEGFENPTKYDWIDKFQDSGKNVSITSLECIHACTPPETQRETPTVFFYQREIVNPEDIEPEFCWVFDYEYVEPDKDLPDDVKYQYSRSDQANTYREDKDRLDKYIQSLPHVRWRTYKCRYEEGGARYTTKNTGRKSFGVGYVDALGEFEETVEADLMEAVHHSFKEPDDSHIPTHVSETIQHENAIKLKASSFVGRKDLFQECWEEVAGSDEATVVILHGEPGCGKSGLLAAVSNKCIKELREARNQFVFVHVVDSCPGSNVLELMLKRLQLSLRAFRRQRGEINVSQDCPQSAGDLKNEHHSFLYESASKYPVCNFVIIVDAVNQFHPALQAWNMWWLPSNKDDAPDNIRFMISTLNEENGTFQNACDACADAVKIPVENMSYDDRQDMVSGTLARFNKKLTTVDDPLLGNQMQLLLEKSESPLYLIAASEALRKFGIFEKVTQYINKLPDTISELFSFLLDESSEEHGDQFIQDVAVLLCVSNNGLLENEMNDLLHYKESKDSFQYDSSFSRLYDSLASFLAAGGGGYLRFFHDQLKYQVRKKYLTSSEVERSYHQWLSDFFYDCCIVGQLCESPDPGEAPAYYHHALQQVVHHQLSSVPTGEPLHIVQSSLRSIYFVRERVLAGHQHSLTQEYLDAIEHTTDTTEIEAFKQWSKFVQLYAPFIEQFPQFVYNMAANQAPASAVSLDTGKKFKEPASYGAYPLYWSNIPSADDAIAMRYSSVWSNDCFASPSDQNVVCVASKAKVFVYEQSSGAVLQQINMDGEAGSVYFSTDGETFWIGDDSGNVSIRDIDTGTEDQLIQVDSERSDTVIWIRDVGEYVAVGTGLPSTICWDSHSTLATIALINQTTKEVTTKWCTDLPCFAYCVHTGKEIIFSGHMEVVRGWGLDGELKMELVEAGPCVFSLCAHPTEDMIVSGSQDFIIKQWNIETKEMTKKFEDPAGSGWAYGGNWATLYDSNGERIMTTTPNGKSIRIYSLDGVMQAELKGHSDCINRMYLIPDREQVVTVGRDGSRLFNIPPITSVKSVEGFDEKVAYCGFLPGANEFVTVAKEAIRIWSTSDNTPRISEEPNIVRESWEIGGLGIHPNGNYICVSGRTDVYWYDTENLELISSYDALYESGNDGSIKSLTISANGEKLLITECRNHSAEKSNAYVYDNTDLKERSEPVVYREHRGRLFSGDIHSDNARALTGSHKGLHLWNMETAEQLAVINTTGCFLAKFVPDTELVLSDDRTNIDIMDIDGNLQLRLNGHTDRPTEALFFKQNGKEHIMTSSDDGTIRVFDRESGTCLYTFFNHRAQQMKCMALHPDQEFVVAGNNNSLLYLLKTKRE